MKPFIVLAGDEYYPAGWDDYVSEADTLEEAKAFAEKQDAEQGAEKLKYTWWEIVDLRLKVCVFTRYGDSAPFDPRSS